MSEGKDPNKDSKKTCCSEDNKAEDMEASTEQNRAFGEGDGFIDIHGTPERVLSPSEERESRRAGGATIAETTVQLEQQKIESDDEYLSADDGETCESLTDVKCEDVKCEDLKCESQTEKSEEESDPAVQDSGRHENDNVQNDNGASCEDIPYEFEHDSGEESEEGEDKKKEEEMEADEEYRKKVEESLSDDEKLERKDRAQDLKGKGNEAFRGGSYKEAISLYNEALMLCPYSFSKERSIMYSNKAVCQMKLDYNKEAIKSCTKALELHPHYLKALLRRAELYEKTDKLDEALADYQKAVELDPAQHDARRSALRLADEVKERNEKMKAEMLGKLKDLGNMILKPFGMSTENFKLNQDPNTGSYSVQFQQGEQK